MQVIGNREWARRAVIGFNRRKTILRMSLAEKQRLEEATIRETPREEVERRAAAVIAQRG